MYLNKSEREREKERTKERQIIKSKKETDTEGTYKIRKKI